MKQGDEVLVYGTLRIGERMDLSKRAQFFSVEFLEKDAINGRLYHLGTYPGLKLVHSNAPDYDERGPTIVGEVFLIKHPSIVAILDAYESYNHEEPKQGLFDREQVLTRSGRIVWVYTYNGFVISEQLIETGDWTNPRVSGSRTIPKLGE